MEEPHDTATHSDNGGERFSNTWPFSGMKEELLEGGLRVPSIVRWPGRIAAGSVSEHVMATRKLYWRNHAGSQRAIRDGNWKYLRIAGNEFLFDVVNDPRERANLKERQNDVFER